MQPLSRDEVWSVIERRGAASRVPVILHFWTHPDTFGDRQAQVQALMDRYPEDVQIVGLRIPDVHVAPQGSPEYRWVDYDESSRATGASVAPAAMDDRVAIDDWSRLPGILKNFPDANYCGAIPHSPPADGRYRVGHWWYCLFERHWQLRGMKNALMDYYTNPGEVHALFRAVTDFYKGLMRRAHDELGLDAIFTSDDIGTQTGPFFSLAMFEEFYVPYYKELIDTAHSLGMHFWLHACGCIEPMLPRLVELGLDVIHPIQKYTMDERDIANRFAERICIWAGFDVQRVIPWGSPAEVREEVRFMMDTYHRPSGGLMFTAGNGINGDCSLDSLEALYEEAFAYGIEVGGGGCL